MSREITITVLLVLLQLAVFRVTQQVVSELYFTSSGLLDRKEDVRLKAVLFRLAIPTLAGASVPLLIDHDEFLIASLAGAIAWLLIVWPAIWLPGLLPQNHRGLILALLLAFWAAFAAMPVFGAMLTIWVREVLSSEEIGWNELIVGSIITLPVGFLTAAVSRLAAVRVTFPLDEEPYVDDPADELALTDEEIRALEEGEFYPSDPLAELARRVTWRNLFILTLLGWLASHVLRRR